LLGSERPFCCICTRQLLAQSELAEVVCHLSAFGGKADMAQGWRNVCL